MPCQNDVKLYIFNMEDLLSRDTEADVVAHVHPVRLSAKDATLSPML
jgi:hypothetical protein